MTKRNDLTLEQKVNVIRHYENDALSQRKLADKFKCSIGQINSILKENRKRKRFCSLFFLAVLKQFSEENSSDLLRQISLFENKFEEVMWQKRLNAKQTVLENYFNPIN